MKNNQVYLDPHNVETSMRQLERFYRLDPATMGMLRRVVERYPRPVIVYVDEANAHSMEASVLDDLFTFNVQTGELVLFSADATTFIHALIEMWMYIAGFETMLGNDDYWKVEFAIGAWKPVRDHIKQTLNIPVEIRQLWEVGLPPNPQETPLEDPYPFKSLVSSFNLIAFMQMIRFAGREDVRVHFPPGTDPKVIEVYYTMRNAMKAVGSGLGIEDVEEFNRRLAAKLQQMEDRYQPQRLPMPKGWQFSGEDRDSASGSEDSQQSSLLLGPGDEEPTVGRLLPPSSPWSSRRGERSQREVDDELSRGPFGRFIETLFDE